MFSSSSSSSSQGSIPMEDRISALPDCLLCHILSFLSTKLAATTSILSKRWNPLWLSLLTLDFDDQTFKDFTTFRLFVSSVFLMRDINLPIRSFHLKCHKASSDSELRDINRIVCFALTQGGLENLNLENNYDVNLNYSRKLPPCILGVLTCRTLVFLKLTKLTISDVPSMIIDLPFLKTLHLNKIFFSANGYIEKLLYGCPILEDLHITKVLLRYLPYVIEGKFKDLPNLVRANLFYFNNLVRAHLGTTVHSFPFALVRNAKSLRAQMGYTYECQVPTFHNLIHMELIFDSERWQGKWKWVIEVLKHCPKLQNLIIDEMDEYEGVIGDEDIEDEDWIDPETVPKCLSSQLRTCLLRNYKGHECELRFAEYIMQNSKLLCTMTIKSSCSLEKNVKYQMLVKLSMCSRGSGTCKLLFD